MAIGFKNSLFGFNKDDVLSYIEKTHKHHKETENKLSQKIDKLSSDLDTSKKEHEKLLEEKQEIEIKLNEFTAKYDEIERLSENIGKLYLVAQTNAQSIIKNSDENAKITGEEVNKNLYSIDEAHKSLEELRAKITKTSEDFVNEVDRLMTSLSDTRTKVTENNREIENSKKEFTQVYENIVG